MTKRGNDLIAKLLKWQPVDRETRCESKQQLWSPSARDSTGACHHFQGSSVRHRLLTHRHFSTETSSGTTGLHLCIAVLAKWKHHLSWISRKQNRVNVWSSVSQLVGRNSKVGRGFVGILQGTQFYSFIWLLWLDKDILYCCTIFLYLWNKFECREINLGRDLMIRVKMWVFKLHQLRTIGLKGVRKKNQVGVFSMWPKPNRPSSPPSPDPLTSQEACELGSQALSQGDREGLKRSVAMFLSLRQRPHSTSSHFHHLTCFLASHFLLGISGEIKAL